MNIQLKKGVLEMCVFLMLENGGRYGYGIAKELSRTISISDGTVHPILRRRNSPRRAMCRRRVVTTSRATFRRTPDNIRADTTACRCGLKRERCTSKLNTTTATIGCTLAR